MRWFSEPFGFADAAVVLRSGSVFFALAVCCTVNAATPLETLRYSPDITVGLGSVKVADEAVVAHDLTGMLTLLDVGALPDAVDIDAYHLLANGDHLLSFDISVSLPGVVTAQPGDVVRFDGLNYVIEFDASINGVVENANLDAVTTFDGDLVLSFDISVELGGTTFSDEDLVLFDGVGFYLFLDGSTAGIAEELDVNAVHYLDVSGNLLLSYDTTGSVDGIVFHDEDVLELDELGNWELVFDGSSQDADWASPELDALHATAENPGRIAVPITVDRQGTLLRIAWPPSCLSGAVDYAIYEGQIGNWYSHTERICSDGAGDLEETFLPSPGNRYYLVVPLGPTVEGSYGWDWLDGERPTGIATCMSTQVIGECPP